MIIDQNIAVLKKEKWVALESCSAEGDMPFVRVDFDHNCFTAVCSTHFLCHHVGDDTLNKKYSVNSVCVRSNQVGLGADSGYPYVGICHRSKGRGTKITRMLYGDTLPEIEGAAKLRRPQGPRHDIAVLPPNVLPDISPYIPDRSPRTLGHRRQLLPLAAMRKIDEIVGFLTIKTERGAKLSEMGVLILPSDPHQFAIFQIREFDENAFWTIGFLPELAGRDRVIGQTIPGEVING